jgi:hypothetical protein
MRNARKWMLVGAAALLAGGCSASADNGGASACGPGAFTHTDPDFCINLADYVAAPEDKANLPGALSVNSVSKSSGFTITWNAALTRRVERMKADSALGPDTVLVEQGDLPGGGYFRHLLHKGGPDEVGPTGAHIGQYLAHGSRIDVLCNVNTTSDERA